VRVSTAAPAAPPRDPLCRGYSFPAEVNSRAAWRNYRFHLSHRDVEELLAERGVQVSYEATRSGSGGPRYASGASGPKARGWVRK
jgi:putative transposase